MKSSASMESDQENDRQGSALAGSDQKIDHAPALTASDQGSDR